jgi:hypothetical protein
MDLVSMIHFSALQCFVKRWIVGKTLAGSMICAKYYHTFDLNLPPPNWGAHLKIVRSEFHFSSLPSELGSLTSLAKLYIWNNQLTGSIPSELGQLVAMNKLSLRDNSLSGSLSSQLGRLASLTGLGQLVALTELVYFTFEKSPFRAWKLSHPSSGIWINWQHLSFKITCSWVHSHQRLKTT